VKFALSIPMLLILTVWSAACLWFDGPESRLFAGILATGFALAALLVTALTRPIWRMWLAFAVLFFAVQFWWLGIEASNDREWLPSVAEIPVPTIEGDILTLENVRNFHYRSGDDFDEIWETRQYDLSTGSISQSRSRRERKSANLFPPCLASSDSSNSTTSQPTNEISSAYARTISEKRSTSTGSKRPPLSLAPSCLIMCEP